MNLRARLLATSVVLLGSVVLAPAADAPPATTQPARIIFDTDMGNDIDDALALGLLHSLQTRGQCEILAVTLTKNDELAGPYVDAVNTFYGRGDIPIGTRREGANSGSKFLKLAQAQDDGKDRYPHDLRMSKDAPEAVALIRKTLASQPDQSVIIVQVGFFSNLAALLDTTGDDVSPLSGIELVKKKVKFISIMAGSFQTIKHNNHYLEYNVIKDIPAAQKLAKKWPTPIIWSGYEIGIAVPFPAISIERDFAYVKHHPVAEAYWLYNPPPHERPTWDLTSALYAVMPDRGFFELSPAGRVMVEEDGFTRFKPDPKGRDRFLILNDLQGARVREALVQLSSQPPR